MPYKLGTDAAASVSSGLGRDGLEVLFPRLAAHIDQTTPAARERYLAKAFLLLADAHGDLNTALRCLAEAAESGVVSGRGSGP